MVLFFFKIHLAKVMIQTVGYHQILRFDGHIITGNLVESVLRDLDFRRFAFYQNHDRAVWIKNHNVITLYEAVDFQHFLNINQ